MIADRSKIRYISNEIEKLGKGNITAHVFTYKDISAATKNFSRTNLIGEGGFGRVYKGYLESKHMVINSFYHYYFIYISTLYM